MSYDPARPLAPEAIVRRSTNVVLVRSLRDNASGRYLDQSADVRATLLDASGTPVAGAADVVLAYVDGTSGPQTAFRGLLPATLVLADASYTVRVTVTASGGAVREFNVPIVPIDG